MRFPAIISVLVLITVSLGCSTNVLRDYNPTQPSIPMANEHGDIVLISSGVINIDDGSVDFNPRTAESYLNVKGIIGSNFKFSIQGVIPPDILDIELEISNVSMITVYDVIIVFDNLHGKTVINPDSFTDIAQPWVLKPFIAFRKEDPFRAFPWIVDTEQLHLQYPNGASPFVDFSIYAHLGGNTGGVYELSNWQISGSLTPDGGSAIVSVAAMDHQKDVTMVVADTSVITGSYTFFSVTGNPEVWQANITNSQHAPVGTYSIPVMAVSPANPPYQIYNFFELNVQSTSATSFGTDKLLFSSAGTENFPSTSGKHSLITHGNTVYYAFTNHYTSTMGGNSANIFFSKSSDTGINWNEPVKLTAEPAFGDILHYSSLAKQGNNLFLSYQRITGFTSYSFDILKSSDNGDTWQLFYSSGFGKRYPSICADPLSPLDKISVVYVNTGVDDHYDLYVDTYIDGEGWSSNRVNDTPGTGKGIGKPDIAFNSVTNTVMVAWPDVNYALSDGSRIIFDLSSDGSNWRTDILVNDSWVSGNKENNPIMAFHPISGIPGILFDSSPDLYNMKIYFTKATNQSGLSFYSPVNLSGDLSEAYATSLQCDPDGRWLSSWYGSPEIYGMYDSYFMESVDNGIVWSNRQIVNDLAMATCFDPQFASTGSVVIMGWMDYRDSIGKVWIDRGLR